MKRPEKKSESLEIRLPYSQKQAFMEACRERGVTASDVLRSFIADDLERSARAQEPRSWTMTLKNNPFKTAAGIAGTTLAAATLGTGVSLADDEIFDAYDRNSDGVITYLEFAANFDEDGRLIVEVDEDTDLVTYGPTGRAQSYRELFEGLDADQSQTLTRNEFDADGTFTRRSDQTIERGGKMSRVIGLEIFRYDVGNEESTSISITSGTKSVDPKATPQEIDLAYRDLEDEMRKNQAAVPKAPFSVDLDR